MKSNLGKSAFPSLNSSEKHLSICSKLTAPKPSKSFMPFGKSGVSSRLTKKSSMLTIIAFFLRFSKISLSKCAVVVFPAQLGPASKTTFCFALIFKTFCASLKSWPLYKLSASSITLTSLYFNFSLTSLISINSLTKPFSNLLFFSAFKISLYPFIFLLQF